METLTAAFRNRSEMEQAAETLLKQGVINLKMTPHGAVGLNTHPDLNVNPFQFNVAGGEEEKNLLQVLVESSRRRQAEDTISRFGGIL